MENSKRSPTYLRLSDHMCDIHSIHFDANNNEFFAIGVYDQIALATLTGQLITIQELPKGSNVIAQQHTPAGWQFLCRTNSSLTNCILSEDNVTETELKEPHETLQTAAWSPCGQYVAVGSIATTLSVWDTETGDIIMKNSIDWNNEEEFINPPTLSVVGWNKTGSEIICIAEEIITSNIIVWNFKTKKLMTIIQ